MAAKSHSFSELQLDAGLPWCHNGFVKNVPKTRRGRQEVLWDYKVFR